MGLKPRNHQYSIYPFTEVNSLSRLIGSNSRTKSDSDSHVLPSALADGFNKLLFNMALASSLIVFINWLLQ
jgi:hypothetical protein